MKLLLVVSLRLRSDRGLLFFLRPCLFAASFGESGFTGLFSGDRRLGHASLGGGLGGCGNGPCGGGSGGGGRAVILLLSRVRFSYCHFGL